MTYMDKTFCLAKTCRKFNECPHALTPEVQAKAKKWWGDPEAPISVTEVFHECFEPKENDEDLQSPTHS